jgi:HK97 family phage portal protein
MRATSRGGKVRRGIPAAWPGARPERKVSAVGPMIAQFAAGQPQFTPRRYDRLADEAYTRNVIAYQCVRLISDAVASLRWSLFRGEQEIEKHPIVDLIQRQNPMTRGARWWRELVAYHLLAGNAYVEAVTGLRDNAPPSELWNLRPDRVKVIPGDQGMPKAYRYEVNGQTHDFPVDPVKGAGRLLHIREFHPLNDWYGFSPVEAAARYVDMDNAASDQNIRQLQNGASPSGLMIFKNKLEADQIAQAEAKVREKLSGTDNAGRVLVLGGDWDFKRISETNVDMQWLDGLSESARRICAAWNVPHILVVAGESTYNNRENARVELWLHCVLPYVDMLLGDLNPWLSDLFGDEIQLRYDRQAITALEPVRRATREQSRADYQARLITLNEARAEIDYGEMPDGDQLAPQVEAGVARGVAEHGLSLDQDRAEKDFERTTRRAELNAQREEARAAAARQQVLEDGQTAHERALDLEKLRAARKAEEMGEGWAVVRHLVKAADAGDLERKIEPGDYADLPGGLPDDALAEATRQALQDIVRDFGQKTFQEIGLDIGFDIANPAVQDFLEEFAGERIRDMVGATTRRELGEALAKVTREGPTFSKLTRAVMDVFERADRERAEVIARTETTRAAGFGSQRAMELGNVERKTWISSRDNFVREQHAELDGQTVPATEPFNWEGNEAMYPGGFSKAALSVNCRCIAVAIPDEKAAEALSTKDARAEAWSLKDNLLLHHERILTAALREGFARQMRAVLTGLGDRLAS